MLIAFPGIILMFLDLFVPVDHKCDLYVIYIVICLSNASQKGKGSVTSEQQSLKP